MILKASQEENRFMTGFAHYGTSATHFSSQKDFLRQPKTFFLSPNQMRQEQRNLWYIRYN